MAKILIVDDEPAILSTLSTFLRLKGHKVTIDPGSETMLGEVRDTKPEIVLLDIFLGKRDGLDLIPKIKSVLPGSAVIIISGHGDISQAVRAIREGAYDFLEKPIDTNRLEILIANAMRERGLRVHMEIMVEEWMAQNFFVGESEGMKSIVDMVRRTSSSNLSILITGPNGCGKEVLARYIHLSGDRAGEAFIAVNCAAIPRDLFESQLFGHRKGAFTGAFADHEGYFARADGGTLFLDEISEIPADLQSKLLRAIEYGEIQAVGASELRRVSTRIIAASNQDLGRMLQEGTFRQDLFYRLGQVPLELPPLDRRREDIPALIDFLLQGQGEAPGTFFTPDALDYFARRAYLGNIRELKNLIQRLLVLSPERPIDAAAVARIDSSAFTGSSLQTTGSTVGPESLFSETMRLRDARLRFERIYLETQLGKHGWSVKQSAAALGLLPNNLSRRLSELGIRLPD